MLNKYSITLSFLVLISFSAGISGLQAQTPLASLTGQSNELIDQLWDQDIAREQANYTALQQQINDEIQKAYAALQGADQAKENKGKGLQDAAKALSAIAKAIEKFNPQLAGLLTAIAGIMELQGQKDQKQANDAKPPMNTGQQASVSEQLQQQLQAVAAEIANLQAKRAGLNTGSEGGSGTEALAETMEKIYQFVLGPEWKEALGIETASTETSQEVSDIEEDVTDLSEEPDLSRTALRSHQDKVHQEILQEIETRID